MPFDANNKMKSTARLVLERSRYNVNIIQEVGDISIPTWETKKIKDFLSNEKIFYGRVDPNYNAIVVRRDKLTTIAATASPVLVQKFVADALVDVISRMNKLTNMRQFRRVSSPFTPLTPVKGYVSPEKSHKEYLSLAAGHFISTMLPNDKARSRISDFNSFLPLFRKYVLRWAPSSPITRSGYIMSRKNSVLSSGLAVEIYDGDYSDDKIKKELFYNNPAFRAYRDVAYQHGFVIDKHIPWRLVADIASPNLAPYIGKYYFAPGSIFTSGFRRTFKSDLDELIKMAVYFYNTFVLKFSFTQTNKCSVPNITLRKPTTFEEVSKKTKYLDWLFFYADIRNLETGIGYDENQMESIKENARDLFRKLDSRKALGYINNKFNAVSHLGGSLFHDITSRKMAKDSKTDASDVDSVVKASVQSTKFFTY